MAEINCPFQCILTKNEHKWQYGFGECSNQSFWRKKNTFDSDANLMLLAKLKIGHSFSFDLWMFSIFLLLKDEKIKIKKCPQKLFTLIISIPIAYLSLAITFKLDFVVMANINSAHIKLCWQKECKWQIGLGSVWIKIFLRRIYFWQEANPNFVHEIKKVTIFLFESWIISIFFVS